MATRTVSVALVADVGQYMSAMTRASASTRAVGSQAQAAGTEASRGFSLAGKGAVLLGGAALAAGLGLKSAIGAASDLNETMNKSNVIFGDNAGQVERWAKGSARNFGLSQQAALEAASSFGNMLTQLGYTGDEAVAASTNVVALAADLGSFNNLETGDVLDRIAAAMRGEYDSLQLLIPNINAARVEQEALAMTGKTNKDALTAQEKATATLAIVQKDGAAAANDFAETSDGLANSTKIAQAEFHDLQSEIGQAFLPAVTTAMHFVSGTAIPALHGLFEGAQAVIGVIAENKEVALALAAILAVQLAGGIGAVTVAFNKMILTRAVLGLSNVLGVVLNLPAALAAASGALAGFLAAAAPLAAVGAIVYAIGKTVDFATAASDARDEVKDMWQAVDDAKGADKIEAIGSVVDQLKIKIRDVKAEIADNKWAAIGNPFDAADIATANSKLEEYEAALKKAEAAQRVAAEGAPLLAAAFQQVAVVQAENTTITKEAAKAQEDWLKSVQDSLAGYVEPLDTYKGLLEEKTAADRDSAEKTAAATKSSSDSWEDYVTDVGVSLEEYAKKLEEQLTNQENWRSNITKVTARGGIEIGQILLGMGEEGAQITADMAGATAENFERMKNDLIREANAGGKGAADALDRNMKIAARLGAAGAKDTVVGIAKELNVGVSEVAAIASKYGIALASGINPLLGALGRDQLSIARIKAGRDSLGGYWGGGYTGDGGKYEPKGIVHGGEFVFTKEQTSRAGVDQLSTLAGMLSGYSGGGFVSTASVPRPPSTAPYRMPISTAGDATMGKAYGDTVDWLQANLAPQLSAGVGWSAMWDAVHRQFPWAQLTSSFRPGAITATGNRSYHSMGRAIDVSPSMEIFDWIAKNYAATELIYSPANGRQEWHGQPHMYGEPTRGDHWDHVHWAMANGGIIGEPVLGRGLRTGASYSFGENGPETVTPGIRSREFSGGGRGGGVAVAPKVTVQARVFVGNREITDIARVEAEAVIEGAFTAINRSNSARGRG